MPGPSFLDVLGNYMSGEDLERVRSMMGSSKTDFISRELSMAPIKEVPQDLSASIFVRNRVVIGPESVVAGALVTNRGAAASTFSVDIVLDHGSPLSSSFTVDGDSTSYRTASVDPEVIEPFTGSVIECRVAVKDAQGRIIAASQGMLEVAKVARRPFIDAEFEPIGRDGTIGSFHITSSDERPLVVVSKILSGGEVVSVIPISIPSKGTIDQMIPTPSIGAFCSDGLSVVLECDGYELSGSASRLPSHHEVSTPPVASVLRLFAECTTQSIVDVNMAKEEGIPVGAVVIGSAESQSRVVSISAFFDGERVYSSTKAIAPNTKGMVEIFVPAGHVRRDDTFSAEVRFLVSDENGGIVLDRTFDMIVRSRFDMDRSHMAEQTMKFVNPLDPQVMSFIEKGDGPLAKAMGPGFTVTGYQVPGLIVPQIDAVYRAVRDYGMSYVSSTATLRDGRFQRVRTPDRVLGERSGNCIDLSIMFASILEAMDFEPVIAFPYGHAIVGVVMETRAYRSGAVLSSHMKDCLIPMGDGDLRFKALFFEATMCANEELSFADAVESAYSTLHEQLRSINSASAFSLVEYGRQRGIKPIVG